MSTTTIRVVCNAASHRRSRATIVATFDHDDDGWREAPAPGRRGSGVHVVLDRPMATVQLVGDVVTQPPIDELQPDPGAVRERYQLECTSCGLAVTARHETLTRALDGYAAVGRDELDLGLLGRRVSS